MKRQVPMLLVAALLLGGVAALAGLPAPAVQAQEASSEEESKLLPVGQVAPDFTLPLVHGGEVTLANLLKFGKAVLVGFWGIDPKNGGGDVPKLQELHHQLEGKGLVVIGINPVEEAGEVARFVESAKAAFMVAVDGKETNRAVTHVYRARKLPTYYLLDPDGKVLWRSIGLKEATLRQALEKAGIK